MSAPLILLERSPRWAAAFRRELRKSKGSEGVFAAGVYGGNNVVPRKNPSRPPFAIPIREVRSLPHCERELAASSYSVVAVEVLPQNLVAIVQALSTWSRRFPHARFVALGSRGLEPHELLLREAGAIHVTFSTRSLAPLLRVIRRHLARAPQPQQTLEETIWSGLPWG